MSRAVCGFTGNFIVVKQNAWKTRCKVDLKTGNDIRKCSENSIFTSSLAYGNHNRKRTCSSFVCSYSDSKVWWEIVFFEVFSSVLGIRDVNSITSPNSFAVPILITRYNVGLVSSTQSRSLIYTRLTICGLPTDYRKYSKTCFHYWSLFLVFLLCLEYLYT